MKLALKVLPNSAHNKICGWLNKTQQDSKILKVKISAHAESRKANKALLNFLTMQLNLPKNSIVILSGTISTYKIIEIKNISVTQLEKNLANLKI